MITAVKSESQNTIHLDFKLPKSRPVIGFFHVVISQTYGRRKQIKQIEVKPATDQQFNSKGSRCMLSKLNNNYLARGTPIYLALLVQSFTY